jgi:hypothetical protein
MRPKGTLREPAEYCPGTQMDGDNDGIPASNSGVTVRFEK